VSRPSDSVPELVSRAREGDPRSVARLISLVEQGSPDLPAAMAALAETSGRAHVVGLTGPPGVGKSTTSSALVAAWRRAGLRVGVLAVDPSSPFSGGALLGDRVRMSEHALDRDVLIRSMAARGHLGGLATATPQAVRVLEAAGCEVVLVETVGVGQSEVEIAGLADTTLVLLAPGAGDAVQAAKAGVLEVGDLYLVNKADHEGAAGVRRELRSMISMTERRDRAWQPPVLLTVASRGEGVEEVVAAVDRHREHLRTSGELGRRRRRRATEEIEAVAISVLRRRWRDGAGEQSLAALSALVVAGETDPWSAAARLLD
jgi:LAO/AO transport system kinase